MHISVSRAKCVWLIVRYTYLSCHEVYSEVNSFCYININWMIQIGRLEDKQPMRVLYIICCLMVVSDIAIFVLKRDVKLQLTNCCLMAHIKG